MRWTAALRAGPRRQSTEFNSRGAHIVGSASCVIVNNMIDRRLRYLAAASMSQARDAARGTEMQQMIYDVRPCLQ